MANVPSGTVRQFRDQRMLVKELVIDGVEMITSNRRGLIRYVDSVNGGASNLGLTPDSACSTIDIAVGLCTASQGDIIVALPGHNEAVIAAAGLDLDVAGITVYFLGEGANRAKITFSTDVAADMDVDAANITLVNPLFVSGIDALTGPIDVNAADFTILNGEYRDAAAMAATDVIVADAGADRMRIDGWKFIPSTTGTQKQSNIQVAAADDVIIRDVNIVGNFGTGAIENGTAWVRALLENVVINNLSASPTVGILLQATSTGSMRDVHIRIASGSTYLTASNTMQFFECFGTGTDATAGEKIGTLIAGDIETKIDTIATSTTTTIPALHAVPTADVTTDVNMRDIIGRKTDTAQVTIGATSSLMRYMKGLMASTMRTVVKTDGGCTTATDILFTVTGGPIRVVSIVGRVTTVIQNQTTTLQIRATTTAPAGTTAMSTAVDCDNDAVGTVYTFVGPTGVLTPTTAGLVLMDYGSTTVTPTQWIVPPGDIHVIAGAISTGVVEWSLAYIPLSPAAVVAAAA